MGELTPLPRPPNWILGSGRKGRGGKKKGEREGTGGKGREEREGREERKEEGRKGSGTPLPAPTQKSRIRPLPAVCYLLMALYMFAELVNRAHRNPRRR